MPSFTDSGRSFNTLDSRNPNGSPGFTLRSPTAQVSSNGPSTRPFQDAHISTRAPLLEQSRVQTDLGPAALQGDHSGQPQSFTSHALHPIGHDGTHDANAYSDASSPQHPMASSQHPVHSMQASSADTFNQHRIQGQPPHPHGQQPSMFERCPEQQGQRLHDSADVGAPACQDEQHVHHRRSAYTAEFSDRMQSQARRPSSQMDGDDRAGTPLGEESEVESPGPTPDSAPATSARDQLRPPGFGLPDRHVQVAEYSPPASRVSSNVWQQQGASGYVAGLVGHHDRQAIRGAAHQQRPGADPTPLSPLPKPCREGFLPTEIMTIAARQGEMLQDTVLLSTVTVHDLLRKRQPSCLHLQECTCRQLQVINNAL